MQMNRILLLGKRATVYGATVREYILASLLFGAEIPDTDLLGNFILGEGRLHR